MTQTNYRLIAVLFSFYFIQGLPYGLQMHYLPLVLRDNGVTLTKISLIRLTTIPWLLKFMWAPFFDHFERPIVGWILVCLAGSATAYFFLALALPSAVTVITYGLVFLNVFASAMDIAVDSLALQSLETKDLGLGNIAQAVGYKSGMLLSGGILLFLYNYIQWKHVFAILFIGYIIITMLFCLYTLYRWPQKGWRTQKKSKSLLGKTGFSSILHHLLLATLKSRTFVLITYVFVYKLGEQGFLSMLPLFLKDENIPIEQISKISGLISIISSMAGSTLSGLAISRSRWTSTLMLKFSVVIRAFLLCFSLFLIHKKDFQDIKFCFSHWLFCVTVGTVTTSTFTIMMEAALSSDVTVQTSFYTCLSAVEVLGKLIMTSFAGIFVTLVGYQSFFFVCLVLNILSLPLVWTIKGYKI